MSFDKASELDNDNEGELVLLPRYPLQVDSPNEESHVPRSLSEEGVSSKTPNMRKGATHDLIYTVDDTPPWHTTLILGLQHFLTNFGSNVSSIFILAPFLCISHDAVKMGELISTLFMCNGLATLLQTTFGVRLPIIQGTSFAFLIPSISILTMMGDCPASPTANSTDEEVDAAEMAWLTRIREIQGATMVASFVQVLIGATGIIGILLHYIGPIAITSTITVIGLTLHQVVADKAGTHWGISFMTMVFIILFSQYIAEVGVPIPAFNRGRKCHLVKFKLFKLFPIILSIIISWVVCVILTETGVFTDDPNEYGYAARTDLNGEVLQNSNWFEVPYPGQWGKPTVTFASVIGMMAGVLASIVESVGDYYACARMSGAPPPPQHAINRGILVEGIGCVLSGAWGSGNGTTSHSENIGAIGITKVGSRRVVQAAGCIMIVTSLFGKVGAMFATMPDPIVGGILMITFGMVTAVGISNVQFVDLNSSRNLFVLGFSIIMGIGIPYYFNTNPQLINTGSPEFDQIITVMLNTGMFVAGLLAMILDNTIPGTDEERGILAWRETKDDNCEHVLESTEEIRKRTELLNEEAAESALASGSSNDDPVPRRTSTSDYTPSCYDLPVGMRYIRGWKWCRYIPFSPTFRGFQFGRVTKTCKKSR